MADIDEMRLEVGSSYHKIAKIPTDKRLNSRLGTHIRSLVRQRYSEP